ncbi:CPSF A subunit region-domain-containing protein [Dunaliella salina]|nr:CPSF A subunit region-domain-containing protein [Dunaliella salina]|eukprot:KAF5839279.1 CPSF A subunit region-domain-containing protein [Dunaliella salina]
MLIPVPGGADGPGGVLVCAENFIIYKNQDHEEVRAVIPRRNDLPGDRGVLIVSYASHKKKAYSFFLVQSEYGDIYKVTLEAQQETVTAVKVKYFDTVPPCASIAVLKTGFLFAASEYGNHALYQFIVANLLGEEIPQIYALTGRGPRSALAVLRPGLAVTELAASPLPGNPTAVFTVKHAMGDEFDAYIVVSFTNATLVFAIGEEVKETNDSGFLGTVPTLHTQLLADNSLLQVHPGGLRHIRPDRRINEWKVPGRRQITRATTNEHQVAIALGGDVIYFELDPMGQLLEAEKKEMGDDVACLDIAPVPEGRARCRFLAVGCYDSTVRVLGRALPAIPESLLMLYGGADEGGPDSGLFLQVALQNGVLMRTEVDRISGQLTDPRSRFLGTRPPRLFPVSVRAHRSMLALSSRPWLGFSDHGRFSIIPLSYEALDYAAGFASDQCPEGFVAVSKGSLRILAVENVGETFNQQVTRLRYTPRRLAIHPTHNTLFVAEADHAAIPLAEREDVKERLQAEGGMESDAVQGIEFDEDMAALEEQFGTPRGQPGQWAACLRIVDPATLSTAFVVELDNNEGIQSMCLAPLASPSATNGAVETMLVVGTASGLRYYPTECDAAYLRVYRILDAGRRLELLHKTQVDGGPVGALCAFKSRLLAGCGSILRLYELGKKKMLRKCEYKQLPHYIASLNACGSRIYVGDSQESVHFMKYKKADNHLYIFADDASPRYVTSVLPLDYDTMAVADKFGNVGVLRLPPDVSAQVIVYGTAMGGIGAFYPFSSREDADFFTHLEMHMRQEHPPLCGRDHMAFRSAYWPVKDCVDGDLCAQYPSALGAKQRSMAEELDRTPGEVLKKLEDIRNKIL